MLFGLIPSKQDRELRAVEHKLRMAEAEATLKLIEGAQDYYDNYVDTAAEVLKGGWIPIGGKGEADKATPATDIQRLLTMQKQSRSLCINNEFAINAVENLISHIVGKGMVYSVSAPAAMMEELEDDEGERNKWAKLVTATLDVWEEFAEREDWGEQEQEAVRRGERDGEFFKRLFPNYFDGRLTLREIEPSSVVTPDSHSQDKAHSMGIETDPEDTQTRLSYWVGGEQVEARYVYHLRRNVDRNVKRGVPTFYPVRSNLERAEQLLTNMSTVSSIQAAIAFIRYREGKTQEQVKTILSNEADIVQTDATTQKSRYRKALPKGAVLNAPMGTKYDFPAHSVENDKHLEVLGAELRAIASRLVMPEYMLTSDASNANYASTLVAESPSVRMFERLQATYGRPFKWVFWEVITLAVELAKLPPEALLLDLGLEAPSLVVRNKLEEAKTKEIEYRNKVLSRQTWCAETGRDYEREQRLRSLDEETHGTEADLSPFGIPTEEPGSEDDEEETEE